MAQKFTNKRRKEKRWAQIDFLLENMTEPHLLPVDDKQSNSTLSNVFNVSNNLTGYNPTGITMQFINYRATAEDKDNPSIGSLSRFMNYIQPYLPTSLRTQHDVTLWWDSLNEDKISTDGTTVEKMEALKHWFVSMRHQIENELTSRYFQCGRLQMIEILKRRWRDNWGDKQEISTENKTQISGDTNTTVTYKILFDLEDEEDAD